jgi:hypothetical protein
MSFKLKTLAALAVAGAATAGAVALSSGPVANAATQHCGNYCETMASQSFGTGQVIAVSGNGGVLLAPGYNSSEDFVGLAVGTVQQLAGAGKISASLAKSYAQEIVYQFTYQPTGDMTGACLADSGGHVALEYCGAPFPTPHSTLPASTLWIGVYRDHSGNFEPFLNAAASTTSAQVLTATSAGGPLAVKGMTMGYGGVEASQMWESLIGIYGQATAWPTPNGTEPPITGR